jgi:transposase
LIACCLADSVSPVIWGIADMMGPRQEAQAALFYEFDLDGHVPAGHVLRQIDRFVDLSGIRSFLAPFYSSTGRPSIDPELMIRMLLVGYCMGIRSERRLCEEVHLNLAYRWFCRLDLNDTIPDHSTFSKNRHGRFRESDLFRHLFNTVLARCIAEGLVGGEEFGVDASLIRLTPAAIRRLRRSTGPSPIRSHGPPRNTSTHWTMRRLAVPRLYSPRPSHQLTLQHAIPAPMATGRSLPIQPTIWSTWTMRSSSMSMPQRPSARRRSRSPER